MIPTIDSVKTDRWVETSIHRQIEETIAFAIGRGATATITGRPGIGKSTALRRIQEEDERAIFIEYQPRFRTMKGLHKAFLEAHGYGQSNFRSTYDMEEVANGVAKAAASAGHFLMVDEFQNFDLEAIRGLLRFSDYYELPIILIGNLERMRRQRCETHTFEQISDRIWKKLTLNDPDKGDFLAFAAPYDVEGRDAWDVLVDIGTRTTLRHLVHVLKTARGALDSGSLKAVHLRAAEAFIAGETAPQRRRA